jgi:hypothetical protein
MTCRAGHDDGVSGDLAELRDRLTRQHLAATGEAPEATEVRGFDRQWWDGAAHVPAVIVRLAGSGRCRLVETGGHVVAVPARGWRARRAIRQMRRRAEVDPQLLDLARHELDPAHDGRPRVSVVRQRSDLPMGQPTTPRRTTMLPGRVVHIEQGADVVRCGSATCAALVPIPPPGRLIAGTACPRCGRVELPGLQVSPSSTRRVALL